MTFRISYKEVTCPVELTHMIVEIIKNYYKNNDVGVRVYTTGNRSVIHIKLKEPI